MSQPVVFCRLLEHGKDLELPKYESSSAAGADLRAALRHADTTVDLTANATDKTNVEETTSICLKVGNYAKIPTALQIALPPAYEAQVRPRSGLAAKYGVTVLNAPGTIDADYRGEICVLLINHGKKDFVIKHGDRIAQLVIAPVVQSPFQAILQLPETERGGNGFGSSGMQ